MKTIGFIDFYLSEWHANNYPNWIKQACEGMDEEFVVKYAWAEQYVSPVDGRNTDEWCAEFGVEKCETIEEVCEKADYILVLAPSNPETHLRFAEKVLTYKKNTYIDKTFAPDYATAKKMFDIAESYGTKFFTSSALRYATELEGWENPNALLILGGGGNLDEYVIHQIEMLVKTMQAPAKRVRVEPQGEQYVMRVEFVDGRFATMVFSRAFGYSLCFDKGGLDTKFVHVTSDTFKGLIKDMLHFYQTGEVSFDTAQTLEVMKIREAVLVGKTKPGEWVDL
jgi:predicted dehydrogenase